MNPQEYSLNIRPGAGYAQTVKVSQGDVGRPLRFNLLDGAEALGIQTGTVITIHGTKPSGLGFTETCTLSGSAASVLTTLEMTQENGMFPAELVLTLGNEVIGTANFMMNVERSPHDENTIDGTYDVADSIFHRMDTLEGEIDQTNAELADVNTNLTGLIEDNTAEIARVAATVPAVDATLTVSGAAADAKKTGDEITQLKSDLNDIGNATVKYVEPTNLHNPNTDETGVLLYTGKGINSSATGVTTDFIPVSEGDTVYYTAINPAGAYMNISAVNFRWLAWYTDKDMSTAISCNAWQNSAVAPEGAKYFRASLAEITRLLHSITINWYPKALGEMEQYFSPYYQNLAKPAVNKFIVDCWGDSRTAMINNGTSFTDYLQTLLGNSYNVCNYGVTSQSSGNCAMRLGANEVFISVANNTIPASGAVALSALRSMASDQFSVYAFNSQATSPCIVGGVRGRLNRSNTGDISQNTFIRDCEGAEMGVRPYTKVCVDDMGSKHHACVFWWGKNDYSKYQGATPNKQILDNYKAAVDYIRHDYFVILGETCSIGTDWESGGSKRVFMDALNAELANLYPNNYIDINAWLSSEDALTSVGLTATAEDLEFISKGFPAYQLMVYSSSTSDTVHPNEYGRQAIANRIYSWMKEKGWAY